MNYWNEWKGGERPVPPDTMVEIRLRDGQECPAFQASRLIWSWTKNSGISYADIVAYRVVSDPPKPDMVNSPPHYTDGGIEAIDYIKAKLGPDGFRSFCLGNALKYISRAGKKGSATEDLSKAIWYLRRAGGG